MIQEFPPLVHHAFPGRPPHPESPLFWALFLAAGSLACTPSSENPPSEPSSGEEAYQSPMDGGGVMAPGGGFPLSIEDASGASLVFHHPPTRIVSLVPSATQTLQALGAQSVLVGRTEYDTANALAALPSVGGGLEPSLETLVALEPDLVIRFAGESDPSTPARLDDLGVHHMAVRLDQVEDVRILMRELGSILGLGHRASDLVERMDTTLHEIQRRVEGLDRVRVAYILGGNPPWVAGPGSFIDELLTMAGGENSFSDLGMLYGPVSPEELLVREIDLLLAPEGGEILHISADIPLLRVSTSLELPGPDLADAAWELAGLLHPEAFR